MKHGWYLVTFAGLVAILATLAPGCASVPASGSQLSEQSRVVNQQILDLPAEFQVGPLTVERNGVTVGESATISAMVTNVGDKPGTYTAILTLDGREVGRKDVTVASKISQNVSFIVTPTSSGKQEVAIGNSKSAIAAYSWPFTIIYDSDTRLGGKGPEHGAGSYYGTTPAMPPAISVGGNYGHMVRFTPPAVPFKIREILVNAEVWVPRETDLDKNYMTVRIWDDKSNMLWSIDLPWRQFRYPGDWNKIVVPNKRVNGDFNVEIVTHSDEQDIVGGIPLDYSDSPTDRGVYVFWNRPQTYLSSPTTVATSSAISHMGKPVEVPSTYQGLNWHVRAVGDGSVSN
jgi:hypothetical protein